MSETKRMEPRLRTPRTSEIPPEELKDIMKEISARMTDQPMEPSPHKTKMPEFPGERMFYSTSTAYHEQDPFQMDIDRMGASSEYRRLAGKTQMCAGPVNDHISTRQTHVQEVARVAKNIAKGLGLNPTLAEAIGGFHDLGHAPLGHFGETLLTGVLLQRGFAKDLGVFMHNAQGLHVVDRVSSRRDTRYTGLNLTHQVRDGILFHDGEKDIPRLGPDTSMPIPKKIDAYLKGLVRETRVAIGDREFRNEEEAAAAVREIRKHVTTNVSFRPSTMEGCLVLLSDSAAYMPSDMEDAIRLGYLDRKLDIPVAVKARLGDTYEQILRNLEIDLMVHSYGKDTVGFSEEVWELVKVFKNDVLRPVYFQMDTLTTSGEEDERVTITAADLQLRATYLFDRYMEAVMAPRKHQDVEIIKHYFEARNEGDHYSKIAWYVPNGSDAQKAQMVIDYISGFTDEYFIRMSDPVSEMTWTSQLLGKSGVYDRMRALRAKLRR